MLQVHEDEELSEEEETLAEDTVTFEKQLAWAEHRMRELESLLESTVSSRHASASSPACPCEITPDGRAMHASLHSLLPR